MQPTSKPYAAILWSLLGLFALRVCAQFVQAVYAVPWLPPFDAWQGSGLPYGGLVTAQALLIALMARLAWLVSTRRVTARRRIGSWCLALGAVYFTTMLLRLVVGTAGFGSHRWFAAVLPAVFHLVLASFVLVVGMFHRRGAAPPPLHYLVSSSSSRSRRASAPTLARTVRRSMPRRRAVS